MTREREKRNRDGLSRREWLQRGALTGIGLGAALLGGTGCQDIQMQYRKATGPTPPDWTPLPGDSPAAALAVRVLNRSAFGPRPGDVARIAKMGAAGWLEEQLALTQPEKARLNQHNDPLHLPVNDDMDPDEDPGLKWRVGGLDIHEIEQDDPNELYCQDDGQLVRETEQAALLRAVYSRHQLREVMADFWTNHFNIYALKLEGRSLVPSDTERVIRPHVLGNFEDMLKASAHSPAMLTYLDNKENKSGVANENYAREILELHTLGVKSGYTQKDIQAVARCFTGWTVGTGVHRSEFVYDPKRHDMGYKFIPFLNLRISPTGKPGAGITDAETVLTTLARHPVTARFLATKICRRLLGAAPPDLVEKAANAYQKSESRSDIRALLRPILLDGLLSPQVCKPIVKRPLDVMTSALRSLAADTDGGQDILRYLANMGQPLYQWPMPDGFPEKASSWTSNLMPRWNFALALASNRINGTKVDLLAPLKAAGVKDDERRLDTLLETVMGRPHNTPELAILRGQLSKHAHKLRGDQVKDKDVLAETVALLFSSPAFQLKA